MADRVEIASDQLSAVIDPFGAELQSLRDADGRELMTNADPTYWAAHAPLLFPFIGALAGGQYRVDGQSHTMAQHGFARRMAFEVVERGGHHARFRLSDSDQTRAAYPFEFTLEMAFAINESTLAMTATLINPGTHDLPASFGYHPAFAWPLPYDKPRAGHRMLFERAETAPVKTLESGLIAGERRSPLEGATLHLSDELFAHDALMWLPVESRSLIYGAADGPQLEIAWDAPDLGVWTKPGAAFVCVEPWWGHADPAGFAGDIWEKPGIMRLAPGERRDFAMRVTLTP